VEVGEGHLDGAVVEVGQALALLAVGLVDGLLDRGDGFVVGQDAGDGEEAGLHDGVDAPPHARVLGHPVGVDHPQLEAALADAGLHGGRQAGPHRSAGSGVLSRKTPPGAAWASRS
jgi:hypothetical protein